MHGIITFSSSVKFIFYVNLYRQASSIQQNNKKVFVWNFGNSFISVSLSLVSRSFLVILLFSACLNFSKDVMVVELFPVASSQVETNGDDHQTDDDEYVGENPNM